MVFFFHTINPFQFIITIKNRGQIWIASSIDHVGKYFTYFESAYAICLSETNSDYTKPCLGEKKVLRDALLERGEKAV